MSVNSYFDSFSFDSFYHSVNVGSIYSGDSLNKTVYNVKLFFDKNRNLLNSFQRETLVTLLDSCVIAKQKFYKSYSVREFFNCLFSCFYPLKSAQKLKL